ncbi:LysR family transcriptional regulator [Virgibacillus profundi]|uniref:LysR family transcriptional regulator n=1 Tax=Virgibacillus profundi TaxID=2024555 RepID=A0A2A2IJG1_9BACI|nr:LysR substrate-binding domain-containing protein [Virgibacillus profundi]PAV31662.1 LysR family transcriptional regulator [Virgibacillus profundi]PXY55848.1 LysR family transcriptional regulator [Virgibacillus profundi]
MDLRQLECFMAVSKELHFSRAAEKLYISQPSLSQQIKNLEAEVGTPLFDRIGKKTALTEAGSILLIHSQRIFHEIEQSKAEIRELNVLQRGKLTIGSLLTCISYLLPPTIINFKRLYPNIELSILGLRTGDIKKRLLENELDLGIVFLPVDDEEIESIPLFTEELSLAVPLGHPLAEFKEIEMKKLEDTATILLPENYQLRKLIDKYCVELGITLKSTLEMTTMESLIQMVSEGIGVTILPEPYIDYLKSSQIAKVKLINPTPQRDIGFIYRKDKFMCATTKSFIDQLGEKSVSL